MTSRESGTGRGFEGERRAPSGPGVDGPLSSRSVERDGTTGLGRARAALVGSAWGPVALKLAGYLGGFVALALVGSGAASWRIGAARGDPALTMGLAPAGSDPEPSASAPRPADPPDAGPSASDAALPDGGGVTADGRVILNLATEDELRRLPGIGATKAKAIVALRAKLGRFRKPEDLLRVKGIGRRSLARMRPLLLVDPPSPQPP